LKRVKIARPPQNRRAIRGRGNPISSTFESDIRVAKPGDQQKLQMAVSLHQQGRLSEAAKLYRSLIDADPQNSHALHLLGLIEAGMGHFAEAQPLLARAVSLEPSNIQLLENYASILFQMGDYKSALDTSTTGLVTNDASGPLLYVNAVALFKLDRFNEALAQFDKLLTRDPGNLPAINERGSVLAKLQRDDEALVSFEKALSLDPAYTEAHLNRAALFAKQDRYQEAMAAYDRLLALKPDLALAWLGRGNLLAGREYDDEASAAYDRAIALDGTLAGAWVGRGDVALHRRRFAEALTAYDKAFALKPDLGGVEGLRLYCKMQLCDWSNFDTEREHLIASIEANRPASQPLVLLAIPSSAEQQLQCAKAWIARQYPSAPNPIWRGERYDHKRIGIAYMSGDFRQHAISHLIAGLFECHDKSRFEITALSNGPADNSELRRRIMASVDRFIDIRADTDEQVAQLVRSSEIDVLVDVSGYTQYARTNVLARRPAPIQINYLGYPGTMGAPYFDYIIVDRVLIPEQQKQFYSEKIVFLPHTYQANDAKRSIPKKNLSRDELGLPPAGFVFCCFNNCYKIIPQVFDSWMRVLKGVEQSVLWLFEENETASLNLRREAAARNINPERLLFAKPLPHDEHMARLRMADLLLDTAPYNSHTTGSDALWAGVPIVTCIGETFASRVAASLLTAIGLPELVTSSPQASEALAIELAEDPVRLAAIKQNLARNRLATPLFGTARYTKHIEAAYTTMVERYQAGLAPANISVPETS
jgi:predicted O-linked N-acetylglucosamine transferase (SPINDLY family)